MSATKSLVLRRSRRKYRFALMPLADTMFQLLIFFMLSSNLTPFSMLTLRSAVTDIAPAPQTPGDGSVQPGDRHVWLLRADHILYDGTEHRYDTVADLAQGFADQGPDAAIVVVIHSSALMQNVATVLEALRVAGIPRVQMAAEAF